MAASGRGRWRGGQLLDRTCLLSLLYRSLELCQRLWMNLKPDLMNGMLRWRNKWIRVIQPNQKNIGLFLKLVDLLFQRAISLSYS